MRLLLLLIASLAIADTYRIHKVYVSDSIRLNTVIVAIAADGNKTYYYNNKRMDLKYEVVPCNRPERNCLVEKGKIK